MRLGVTIFATDLTMTPGDLARESEQRGFGSLYVPEHTHMPLDPGGPLPAGETELDEGYRRTLDPWIALTAAAAVTERLVVGTGVCLPAQHDPIVLAKQIATLDHLAGGRVTLGIGYGWNRSEARDHGVEWKRRREVAREHMLAMRELWGNDVASFDGEFVRFAETWSWPKPVSGANIRTLVGGAAGPKLFAAIAEYSDGWMPFGGAGVAKALPELRAAFEVAGRDPATVEVVPFGVIPDHGKLEYYGSLGITEVVLRVPAATRDEVLPVLDEYTEYL